MDTYIFDIEYRTAQEMAAYGRGAGWYIFSGDAQAPTATGPVTSREAAENYSAAAYEHIEGLA